MADEDGESLKKKTYEQCSTLQSMIDISIEHLDGLRTCAIDAELIQQEIRSIEVKLIKLFSKQLLNKQILNKTKIPTEELPQEIQPHPLLKQWLHVAGLSAASIKDTCNLVPSLESLLEKSDNDIKLILKTIGAQQEEARCLVNAVQNLKKCIEYQLKGDKNSFSIPDLYWDSWDRGATLTRTANTALSINNVAPSPSSSPHPSRSPQSHSSVSSDDVFKNEANSTSYQLPPWSPVSSIHSFHGNMGSPFSTTASHSPSSLSPFARERDKRSTPPSTPPTIVKKGEKLKFPTTPPPRKKQTIITLDPDAFPLTKSKSHESQLGNRIDHSDNALVGLMMYQHPNVRIGRSCEHLPRRQRLQTEPVTEPVGLFPDGMPEHSSPQINSPVRSPPYTASDLSNDVLQKTIIAPKSPRTPTITNCFHMGHAIQHRFTNTLKMTNCDYCFKPMFIGYKCKECKFVCHRDCSLKTPPSCGLPNEYLEIYRQTVHNDGSHSPLPIRPPLSSPLSVKEGKQPKRKKHPNINIQPFPGPDSSSNTSSCNSSTPSSPALAALSQTPPLPSQQHQFQFPDVVNSGKDITIETRPLDEQHNEMVETQKSNDSDKTVSGTSGSTDSEKTLAGRVDSQDSQISDVDPMDRSLPRQNSLSLREWDIPYNELGIEDAIGTGRFGKVYRGNWHGDVAIKFLNMDHMDDEKTLDAFKQEVATFRKTRHENLVLFMGACMKPPHLAIITSLCKGMTLYTHIHLRKERFNMNKIIMVAQQISQGMGYLHARGIVHKDLKTKNIFLESGKVIITDFGLFSVTKLCYGNRKGNWLTIPPGWLCYLAPEIICCLRAAHDCHENDNLPFTVHSDVYAFGTVWYELLCGEWPFKGQPPEAIIWQAGRGIKQSLASVQATRDVKDILMICWSFKPSERPEFSQLLKMFDKLPKKRLARSPSHPIHLSRSAESIF